MESDLVRVVSKSFTEEHGVQYVTTIGILIVEM